MFAFTIGFYALRKNSGGYVQHGGVLTFLPAFGERAGFNVSFPITGLINALTLFPLVYLWSNGEWIREKQGKPQIHEDL